MAGPITVGADWLSSSEIQRENFADAYYNDVLWGSGVQWNSHVITWSTPSFAWGDVYYTTNPVFTPFTTQDVQSVTNSLNYLSSIINLTFSYTSAPSANIKLGYLNVTSVGGYEWGSPSDGQTSIYISDQAAGTLSNPGSIGYHDLIHEIGHALALKHSFQTTANPALPTALETVDSTVMSYNEFVFWNPLSNADAFAQSYMPFDIRALLSLYGPAQGITAGNFTFKFSETASFAYGTQNSTVNIFAPFYLYDTNHAVTLDFSLLNDKKEALVVDLRDFGILYAQASGLPYAQYNYASSTWSDWNYTKSATPSSVFNIDIYSKTNISNIVGSPLDDTVIAGANACVINGGGGIDTIVYGVFASTCSITSITHRTFSISDTNGITGALVASGRFVVQLNDKTIDPFHLGNNVINNSTSSVSSSAQGTSQNDSIYLSPSITFVSADAGDDVIYIAGYGGSKTKIDGGAGTDVAVFSNVLSQYTVSVNGSLWTVTDNTANRDGTVTLVNVEYAQFADQTIISPPIIVALTDTAAATLAAGHLITITLTGQQPLMATGSPSLQLSNGELAIYSSGSGTNTLTFTYMVQPGDSTPDLQVTGLNLPGGASIVDATGASPSATISQDLAIKIDTSTSSATSVQQEVMGLYGALYGRAGEFPAYSFWVGYAGPGLNTGNAGSTAVTLAQATTLGQGFVNSQNTFFNQTYGALNDSQFINAMYLNIGGAAGDPNGVGYWSGLLAQAEAQGQSVQAARAGLVGQFVQILVGFDTSHRLAGLTDQQWADALTRTETISNKIAVSLAYANASNGTGGSILVPAAVGDAAYNAAVKVLQGVTADPHTVAVALAGISNAVSHHDLTMI